MNDKNLDSQKSKLKEMKKAPELRFKGFSDDWEQRKFKDFSKKTGKKNSKDLDLPAYSVSNKSGLISQTEQFDGSRLDSLEKTSYKFVEPNEFAYNPARINVGSIAFNNLGMAVIVSSLYVVVKMSEDLDNGFILQFIKSPTFIKEVKRNTEGSVREYLFYENFANIKFPFAKNKEEQQKIGIFFQQLDETIVLHQRKLEKLKQLKLAYLQQLFPKNGENTPRIRFAYFEENWEQRKAKEIFIAKVKKGKPNLPVLSVTQDFGVVYRNEVGIDIKYDNSTLSNYKIIEPGDFVISLRSFQGGFELSDKLGITSPAYTIFIPKNLDHHNQLYWKAQFKTKKFIDSLKIVTFGIRDGKSISFSEFGDLKIMYPIDVDEQRHIGILLQKLNQTLALHQSKIDKLKSIKQSLLQKMFI
ncbi:MULTISPECIES: restriction endonuclease subunit S [Lactococcus]|uniref:restriction endonuclease subunit S n=1 Tax=Lactococcus TaxID=1357 RepID=UPI001F5E1325|nr:restriction endonuclease subunit S [Lactococcus sp. LG1267]